MEKIVGPSGSRPESGSRRAERRKILKWALQLAGIDFQCLS
jgi:hypothetical protein